MILNYIEWNGHAMGNYEYQIPVFISEKIKETQTDVFMLCEFIQGQGFNYFNEELKDYKLFISPKATVRGYNQICIGIRKSLDFELLGVYNIDTTDPFLPEFLHIKIKIEEIILNLIAIRIKTQGNTQQKQFAFLKSYLHQIEGAILCCGDFNCTCLKVQEIIGEVGVVYGPRRFNNKYSYVFQDGNQQALDHIIVRGEKRVFNPYTDYLESPLATYDFSFVTKHNGYGNKTADSYLSDGELPDHALLKGAVEF